MTVSLNLANVANAIAALSVAGVTVKDKDEIAGSWVSLPNVLYPKPEGWITGFGLEYMTVMQGASAKIDISYTLNYRFLGVQIGDLSLFPAAYSDLVDKLILIVNAIVAMDAPYNGSVEMKISGIEIGPRADPAGNNFFGADFAVNIVEMQN
jgi:hypothetical protein